MLSGATPRACETTGTAVFRIVVSSDSMKNATATSHGRSCLVEAEGGCEEALMTSFLAGVRDRKFPDPPSHRSTELSDLPILPPIRHHSTFVGQSATRT